MLETLVLWGDAEERCYVSESKGRFLSWLSWLEDALIWAVESRRLGGTSHDNEGDGEGTVYYPHLKAIYLEEAETVRSGCGGWRVILRTDKTCFKRLITVGRNASADIYTLTNLTPTQYEIELPMAPSKYDLQTVPWRKRRNKVEHWVPDVYKGVKRVSGCGECGECVVCLMR